MQASAVAPDDLRRAARVPEHGDDDVDGDAGTGDVPVEGAPEPLRVARVLRDERVDEHDRVVRFDVHGSDHLAPLGVVRAPPPQPVGDARHLHRRERTPATW
jgi:hypothetical protein